MTAKRSFANGEAVDRISGQVSRSMKSVQLRKQLIKLISLYHDRKHEVFAGCVRRCLNYDPHGNFSVSLSEINGAPPLKKKLQGGSVGNAERNTLPFNKFGAKAKLLK